MMWLRWRGNDDLAVMISLAVALGIVVGAVAALWIASSGPGPVAWGLP